jgi:alkaline phosphatase D
MLEFDRFYRTARQEGHVSRRLFLGYSAALSSLPLLAEQVSGRTLRKVSFAADPFSCGIASGDPTDTGVVLWTRLAPAPFEPSGGLPAENIVVEWELATDEAMTQIVQHGTAIATPQLAHSVHVEVEGLEPARWYWYRFRAGDAESRIGRTRTMPVAHSLPPELRFAFASCQHFEDGFFTAYEHMAHDDLDLVFHLGDYIYEGPGKEGGVRKHLGKEIKSLEDYRIRHALYKSDLHLQAMHAHCPWVVTWDDHEFDNNCACDISEEADFLSRRANAYQAYYEMMPLRRTSLPRGSDMRLYRTISFGRLASFQVLDTRQYRTDQPNGDKASPLNEAACDPRGSLLGQRQAGWLQASLLESPAEWNVLAQQVMMGLVGFRPEGKELLHYSMDQWGSAVHERGKLLEFLRDRRVPNPVVLTGDIHSNWANDLRIDDRQPETPIVAAEFVATSLTSGGNGVASPKGLERRLADNPGVRFCNAERGYVRCTVTPDAWRSDYQVVEEIEKPGGPVTTRAAFVVESGERGIKPA